MLTTNTSYILFAFLNGHIFQVYVGCLHIFMVNYLHMLHLKYINQSNKMCLLMDENCIDRRMIILLCAVLLLQMKNTDTLTNKNTSIFNRK